MVRKLISFDEETWHALMQLGRDRMGDLQELADEAFADLLTKHGVPKNLKDALRKSASAAAAKGARNKTTSHKNKSNKTKSNQNRGSQKTGVKRRGRTAPNARGRRAR